MFPAFATAFVIHAFSMRARWGFPHLRVASCGTGFSPQGLKGKSPGFRRGFCDPAGARTQDPDIKSVVLYQLSYRILFLRAAKNAFRELRAQK